jgi:hypothetical protein
MFLKQTAYKPKSRTSSQSSIPPTPDSPAATSSATTTDPNTNPKPRTASQTWEDRRFMWQTGAPGGRKSSFSAAAAAAAAAGDGSAVVDPVPVVQQKSSSPFAMTKPNTSENPHPAAFVKGEGAAAGTGAGAALRDRHFIWGKGKEVHEGVGERRKVSDWSILFDLSWFCVAGIIWGGMGGFWLWSFFWMWSVRWLEFVLVVCVVSDGEEWDIGKFFG